MLTATRGSRAARVCPARVRNSAACAAGTRYPSPWTRRAPTRVHCGPPSGSPFQRRARSCSPIARLTVAYGEHVALREASLSLREGEMVALVGANGSGKSTLFRAVAGLATPSGGSIQMLGNVAPPAVQRRTAVAGLVPQDPAIALYHESVRDEVAETLRRRAGGGEGADAVLTAALADWNIAELSARNPRDVSVGQQQRVASPRCSLTAARVAAWMSRHAARTDRPRHGLQGGSATTPALAAQPSSPHTTSNRRRTTPRAWSRSRRAHRPRPARTARVCRRWSLPDSDSASRAGRGHGGGGRTMTFEQRHRGLTTFAMLLVAVCAFAGSYTIARADGGEVGFVVQKATTWTRTAWVSAANPYPRTDLLAKANYPVVQFDGLVCADWVETQRTGCFRSQQLPTCVCHSYPPSENTYWHSSSKRYGKSWQYTSFGLKTPARRSRMAI